MTSPAKEHEHHRFGDTWWWLDPAHTKKKCEAALAWETRRRLQSYRSMWAVFKMKIEPILNHEDRSRAGAFRRMHLIQAVRRAVGPDYSFFLMNGFDPSLTWLELGEAQRLKAQGFLLGEREALRVNGEYLLPRQKADRPKVRFEVVELNRDGSGKVVLSKQLTFGRALSRIAHTDFFQRLRLPSGRYVSVIFDARGARDALLAAFDEELHRWVGDWETAMKKAGRFAILRGGEAHDQREYWVPESAAPGIRVKEQDVAVIPSEEPGIAMLLVSARHNPASVRASFHYHLKSDQLKKWHRRCVKYWKTVAVEQSELVKTSSGAVVVDERGFPLRRRVVRHLFDPTRHLSPKQKQRRSAKREDLWLGLAGNDVVTDGVILGKTSAEGRFLREHCKDLTELLNRQRSAARRLKELEENAATLLAALVLCLEENIELSEKGFFAAC